MSLDKTIENFCSAFYVPTPTTFTSCNTTTHQLTFGWWSCWLTGEQRSWESDWRGAPWTRGGYNSAGSTSSTWWRGGPRPFGRHRLRWQQFSAVGTHFQRSGMVFPQLEEPTKVYSGQINLQEEGDKITLLFYVDVLNFGVWLCNVFSVTTVINDRYPQ